METSAKAAINVDEAFLALSRDIKKRLIDAPGAGAAIGGGSPGGNLRLEQQSTGDWIKSSCCFSGGGSNSAAAK